MSDPTTPISQWDNFLRIWAIVGPLTVAAASALWSRYTKSQDRKIDKLNEKERLDREQAREKDRLDRERSREIERFEQANATKNIDLKIAKRDERYSEAKDAFVNFMAYSQDYVLKQMEAISDKTPESNQAVILANEKHSFSYQVVQLIGNEEFKTAATILLNTSLETLQEMSKTPRNEEQYKKLLEAYKNAKTEFATHARKYLSSLDTHVN